MSRIPSTLITAGLIGFGMLAWALVGRPLVSNQDLASPLNPLGINGSPYGEVFAMAMQGPIDTHFDGAMGGKTVHKHAEVDHSDSCKPAKSGQGGGMRLQNLLVSLEKAVIERTNPKSASEAHKRYLRRQVEDKLRFAYNLDPSHYANYNSLHFFLTEPQLGTRPELTPSAAKLAEDTIQYCLKQQNDPRPALTAAAATSNILELMFNDRHFHHNERFTTEQMRQYLNLLDYCIQRYVTLARQWDETKNWALLSPQRIAECDDRFQFILKFREAAEGTIARFENESPNHQVAN
jgi:hypothetical protein